MAYKVLGQTTTTAATPAATIINLIKDPSFEAAAGVGGGTYSSTNAVWAPNANTVWRAANGASNATLYTGGTGKYGTYAWGWNVQGGQYGYISQGIATGWNWVSAMAFAALDKTTAIPVVAGTTYYCGFDLYSTNQSYTTYYTIYWFSDTAYLSTTGPINNNGGVNAWNRGTGSATAPSGATYAAIVLRTDGAAGANYYVDGVTFGVDSTYNTTFTEPILPSIASTTSPFNKKINGYTSETLLSTTGVTYAGALATLYTVPSGKSTVVSTLSITNLTPTSTTYRVAVIPSGETLAAKHFIFFDAPIAGNSTQAITIGMTLNVGDVVKVAADTSTVSATLFGSES